MPFWQEEGVNIEELAVEERAIALERLVELFEGSAEWIQGEVEEACNEKIRGISVEAKLSEGVYRVEVNFTSRGDIEDEHGLSVDPHVVVNSILVAIDEYLQEDGE